MSFSIFLKNFSTILLSLSMLFSFIGCSKPNNGINIKSETINYNNIYDFAHSGFWVNENSIYYRESGFYNNLYYRVDNNGKHLITTDNKFNILVAKDDEGKISGEIQAFGNYVYFWYVKDDGNNVLYQYNNKNSEFEKLLSVNQTVNNWTIVDNVVVYSTFIDGVNTPMNTLWYCYLNSEKPNKIADTTSAFGICDNKIRYTQIDDTGKSLLYEYNYATQESVLLCSFDGTSDYNSYNFTDSFVVFATDKLHIVEIKSGEQKSFALPKNINFLSCYEQYAFTCSDSNVYRTNLATGETELLCEGLDECNLLHSISDECAVAICYNTSGITTKVGVYFIYSNGNVGKVLEI